MNVEYSTLVSEHLLSIASRPSAKTRETRICEEKNSRGLDLYQQLHKCLSLHEGSPLVLVELAPAVATCHKQEKRCSSVFSVRASLFESVFDCMRRYDCVFHLHLTEQDGDADETEDGCQNQASDTQSVIVCTERWCLGRVVKKKTGDQMSQ